jgi:hypothetical protein
MMHLQAVVGQHPASDAAPRSTSRWRRCRTVRRHAGVGELRTVWEKEQGDRARERLDIFLPPPSFGWVSASVGDVHGRPHARVRRTSRPESDANAERVTRRVCPRTLAVQRAAHTRQIDGARLWKTPMQVLIDGFSAALRLSTWGYDPVPEQTRGRCLRPRPRVSWRAQRRPSACPAMSPEEVRSKLELIGELAERARRDRESREAGQRARD